MLLFHSNKYHSSTKHSYNSIRLYPNRVDWNNPPNRFKYYSNNFKRVSLSKEEDVFDFLYLIAGITAKKTYPGMEYYLRVNPSAGALYPNEIYFQVRNEKYLEDGIYHFEVGTSNVTLLKKLKMNEGIEGNLELDYSYDGFIFFISSIYYRSSWKYKNRAFRYCLLDAGHILGTIEASCYIYNKSFNVCSDFDKKSLNEIFNFDEKEFFTSYVIASNNKEKKELESIRLEIPTENGIAYDNEVLLYEENKVIKEAYESSLINSSIQSKTNDLPFNFEKTFLKETILKRRSIREFTKKSISKLQYETIINFISSPVNGLNEDEIDIYYVVNRVEDMKIGLYKNKELLKIGDFSKKAGYLCLEQDLGSSSAITFYLTTKNSNYQSSYQKAGLIGHRLYLVSNYLQIGCSGIGAYYDDEVCEFIGDQTMVLYSLAIGN